MTNIDPINALGDPTRRKLFERLREGPCSVNELVETVEVSQSAVSQHLKVLKDAQLVQVEKKGQQRIYRINPAGLLELRQYVEDMWNDVFMAFEKEAAKLAAGKENRSKSISNG
jgi:DNA-binding transcriptional ArsR family regulator